MAGPQSRVHAPLFIGLMSGTSVDGIDAALVRFHPQPALLLGRTYPLAPALAAQVLALSQANSLVSLDDLGALDTLMGNAFASAVLALLEETGTAAESVLAIGSHGQTLRHRPTGAAPFTLQIGDANVIAERSGILTVADFRRRDVAAGGQGAPLVPAFHAAALGCVAEDRAILNIGGVANLTLLPAQGCVRGFDTGPGNGLMDAWCLRERGQAFDASGAFAASGVADVSLLDRLMADPWLGLPPPKSTGRDYFHEQWLQRHLDGLPLAAADVQATLNLFTARSIAEALCRDLPSCVRVLVCGGGVHNPVLMDNLRRDLPGMVVESTQRHGLDPDFVEAIAFAWLARETLAGRPGNLAAVTGARGPRVLGCTYPGSNYPR